MRKHTFKKEERLCSAKRIQHVFHKGSSFVVYPFRIVYQIERSSSTGVQVLISVSKRRFRHAVRRNRLKRLIREAYRLEKAAHLLPYVEQRGLQLMLVIQYVAQDELALVELKQKMLKVFERLQHANTSMDLETRD